MWFGVKPDNDSPVSLFTQAIISDRYKSSSTAKGKHVGGVANYRASEGKTVEVPFRGDVENTVLDILGGIRSTCT